MKDKQRFFEKMVSAYSNDLYRYAYWLCKQPSMAEDLVQETFMRAWKSIEKLNDEKAAKAWLITILRRENARQYEKKQPLLVEIEDEILQADYHHEPLEKFAKAELHKHIMNLPTEYKEPLILQIIWGYSGEEIAQQLQLKLATVNTRLFRARQQLKELAYQDNSTAKKIKGGH